MCGLCYDKGKYIVQHEELYEIVTCDCRAHIREDQDAS